MGKPTKIFFIGVAVSLMVLAAGYLLEKRQSSELDALVMKCKNFVNEAPKGPWLAYQKDPLVCDPTELMKANDLKGIQEEISQRYWSREDYDGWSKVLAAAIVGICFLPYAWYFLLRRIRELVKAVTGE